MSNRGFFFFVLEVLIGAGAGWAWLHTYDLEYAVCAVIAAACAGFIVLREAQP